MKKLMLLVTFHSLLFSCSTYKGETYKKNKKSALKIYFVPNRFTTYNQGVSTYTGEYSKYGAYFEILDKKSLDEFEKKVLTLKPSRGSGRNGKRIKLIYNNINRKDTIYMSYLCNSNINLNRKGFKNNSVFSKFIFELIKENYSKNKVSYYGSYYTNHKDEMKDENLTFIQDRINDCTK